MLLIEQDVDHPVGSRIGRWWTAFDGSYVILPMVMVGSGYQISNGYVDFYTTYKNMIEAEKARPPLAEVNAYYQRVGDHFEVRVAVTNKSGVELSYANQATVHVLVYEEAAVNITGRFVRAATATAIATPLAHGQTASFDLTTADIAPLDWGRVHIIALVDYLPQPAGPYDTLQAAAAIESLNFGVTPDTVVFMMSPTDTAVASQRLTVVGPPQLTWQVTGSADWFAVTPLQGDTSLSPQLSLVLGNVTEGWQEKTITLNAAAANETFQANVLVRAYRGPLNKIYLPAVSVTP